MKNRKTRNKTRNNLTSITSGYKTTGNMTPNYSQNFKRFFNQSHCTLENNFTPQDVQPERLMTNTDVLAGYDGVQSIIDEKEIKLNNMQIGKFSREY